MIIGLVYVYNSSTKFYLEKFIVLNQHGSPHARFVVTLITTRPYIVLIQAHKIDLQGLVHFFQAPYSYGVWGFSISHVCVSVSDPVTAL